MANYYFTINIWRIPLPYTKVNINCTYSIRCVCVCALEAVGTNMKPTRNKKNFLNRKKMYRKMSKTNIWEIHARIEPYENVFETMLPHRDQEAWTSMSFNKTETNKLEINRKYVAVAVRVSTEMNKRYTKILLAIERNGTLERRKKNERIAWGFFYYIIFFSLLLPPFSSSSSSSSSIFSLNQRVCVVFEVFG